MLQNTNASLKYPELFIDERQANDFWDHLIGRYLLTTPNPETALSFMKAQNVSYLYDPKHTEIDKEKISFNCTLKSFFLNPERLFQF